VDFATEAEAKALPVTARPVLAGVQAARGMSALVEGRYAEAYEHLRRMHDPADPAYHIALRCYSLMDLVEAALHSGRTADVAQVVGEMEHIALDTPSPALHAGLRHARALLADSATAEHLFRDALDSAPTRLPFIRARGQLAYGEWLRRQRRSADSRAPLRAAREAFDALGSLPWSERARQELRASGEVSRRRTPEARDQLTAQELQIAQLAAAGLTNREIGEKLYLSHRTIGSHLYRVFPKLGITSRIELAAVVGADR
jgi:ATP/maltotriose-dependent transcriptional regulator MalT